MGAGDQLAFEIPARVRDELEAAGADIDALAEPPTDEPLPTVVDGRALRDEAVERVDRAADPEWKAQALAAVAAVAERQADLTTDDVWDQVGGVPADLEPRAMGPIMLRAKAIGLIEPTDVTRQATRGVNHARPQRVWRSLVRVRPIV